MTRLRAVLESLPESYAIERGRVGVLAIERSRREVLLRSGFGPDGGERLRPSDLSGRSPLGAIEAGAEHWVVRGFHHGGFLRWLGKRLFLDPARPFLELLLAERLSASGIGTPRVVAARAVRARPLGWQLALVTVRVEESTDAAELLERMRRGELDARARLEAPRPIGELVGRLHALGFLHADLTPHNLLLARDRSRAWILDLDRGRLVSALSDGKRRDNLRRLYRAVRRREARGRAFLRLTDYLRFLRAYEGGRGARSGWKEDWRAIVARDRTRGLLHRAGWFLEERLGGGPETRDGGAVVR